MSTQTTAVGWTHAPASDSRHSGMLFVLVPVCITLVLVFALFVQMRAWEFDRIKFRAEHDAASLALKLESDIGSHVEALRSIQSFYASSDHVDRREFATFVRRGLTELPGIQALEWIPRVLDETRASHERLAREDGHSNFDIRERTADGMAAASLRPEYYPVYYVEPYSGNEAALGFDLASNPTRLAALNQSRDSGEPIATARITLVQETGKQFGFLIFAPIYKIGLPHETTSQRRQNLRGFALGVFRVGDMVKATENRAIQDQFALQIYDQSAPTEQRLLHTNDVVKAHDSKALTWATTIDVAGRSWSLHFYPSAEYLERFRPWGSWLLLIGGLLFACLLAAVLFVLTMQTKRIRGLVSERTSDLSQANIRLKAREAELARSNAELEKFAYVASHDLKEPLRKVTAFGDRLAAKYSEAIGEKGLDYLDRMRNAASRMQTLIDDLLAFSRITSKKQPFAQVDLNEVLVGVLSDLEASIEQANAIVHSNDLPTINADPTQMRQLLQNLIGNALKFQADGAKPEVHVRSTMLAHENGDSRCEISVQDNGVGFDPENNEKIFEVFQRLHGRGEYDGAGVGLAICRKIAERHGGDISASSTPGQGATFVVTLPMKQSTKGEM